jgi:hypothetical protein
MAWQHISPEVIVKGIKKCCTFNGMYKTDDDMLWNGREMVGNVMSEYEEGEGSICEDGDSDTVW